jgi:hypothetical protein
MQTTALLERQSHSFFHDQKLKNPLDCSNGFGIGTQPYTTSFEAELLYGGGVV